MYAHAESKCHVCFLNEIFIANFEKITRMRMQVVLDVPFPPTEHLGSELLSL